MNKGTEIEHVIAYLERKKSEGYTHVADTNEKQAQDALEYHRKEKEN